MWANISPNTHFQLKLFSRVDIHGLKIKIASFIVIILQSNKIMTSSNGSLFRVTDNLWGEFTGRQWIPLTEANDAELDVFFDLALNKRLSKQSKRRSFETPSCSIWGHCNVTGVYLPPDVRYRAEYIPVIMSTVCVCCVGWGLIATYFIDILHICVTSAVTFIRQAGKQYSRK